MRRRATASRTRTNGRFARHMRRVMTELHTIQSAWCIYALACSCMCWMVLLRQS
jgi:hypothetical protein